MYRTVYTAADGNVTARLQAMSTNSCTNTQTDKAIDMNS